MYSLVTLEQIVLVPCLDENKEKKDVVDTRRETMGA